MRMSTLREETVLYFSRFRAKPADWSNQDLAEFYRVESALAQAGFPVEFDRGLTDEGDPWCAFCRADTGDVVVHFARIDGRCVVASPALGVTLEGASFQEVVRQFLSSLPAVTPRQRFGRDGQLFLHPAAMIVALVATAFCASGPTTHTDGAEGAPPSALSKIVEAIKLQLVQLQNEGGVFRDSLVKLGVLTAIVVALEFAVTRGDERAIAASLSDQPQTTSDAEHQTAGVELSEMMRLAEAMLQGSRSIDAHHTNTDQTLSENDLLQLLADKPQKALAVSEDAPASDLVLTAALPKDGHVADEQMSWAATVPTDTAALAVIGGDSSHLMADTHTVQSALAAQKFIHVLNDLDIKSFTTSDVLQARDAKQIAPEILAPSRAAEPAYIEANVPDAPKVGPSSIPAPPASATGVASFDDVAQYLVLAFIKSDDDIRFLQEGGTMVIFDSSDVLGLSVPLEVKSWAFGAESTISIIGASATLDSILAQYV